MKFNLFIVVLLCVLITGCTSSQKKAQKAQENNSRYQYNLGSFHMNQGNTDEAIKYYLKSISLDPKFYQSLNALGLAYSIKGNFQESIRYFERCLKINPAFSEARNNLGMIYQEMGQIDKAEEEYLKAIADRNYQSRELSYYNLGRLYLAQDKIDAALQNINVAIQLNNRLVLAFNLQGIIYERMNRLEDAIQSYKEGLKRIHDQEDYNLKYNLAVAYFKNNQYDLAKNLFLEILPRITDFEIKEKISEYLSSINKKSPLPY